MTIADDSAMTRTDEDQTVSASKSPGTWVEPDAPQSESEARTGKEPLPPARPAWSKCRNLNLHYGKHQALHTISLEVAEKHVTAFIGPSGCGKSTLLRCINRT